MKYFLQSCIQAILVFCLIFLSVTDSLSQNNRSSSVYTTTVSDAKGCTSTSDAGLDFSICSGNIAGLNGSITGSTTNGQWIGGVGSFDPNRFDPQADYYPDPSEFGTVVTLFLVSDSVATCPSDTDDLNINIILSPALHPIAPVSFCSPDTAFDLNTLIVTDSNNTNGFLSFFDDGNPPMPLLSPIVSPPLGVPTVYNVFKVTNTTPSCFSIQPVTVTGGEIIATSTSTDEQCGGACDGTAVITVTTGNPPYIYLWSNGMTSANITGLCAGAYVYTVTVASGCIASDTVTVNSGQSTTTTINTTDVTCTGGCDGTATATTVGGTPPFSYLWSNGSTTASVSGLCAATYQLTCTDSNGCTNFQSFTITEPANNLPLASFTYNDVGGTVTFTNNSSNASTYAWNFGDGSPIDNSMSPTHTYASSGNFNVTLTVTGPCGSDDTTIVIPIVTGIAETIHDFGISISPNPAYDILVIDLSNSSIGIDVIEMSDALGKLAFKKQGNISHKRLTIDIDKYQNGSYFVHLMNQKQHLVHKILIRK